VNATDPVTVTLEAQQWNVVLGALAETPWRIADPVIPAIARQTQPKAEQPAAVHSGEGEDRLAA